MSIKVERWPVHGYQNELNIITGLATGGGSAASCTILAGLRGVTSITHTGSTGRYYVNFNGVPAGTFLGCVGAGNCSTPTAAKAKTVQYVPGSFSTTNSRFEIAVVDQGATPALADVATDEVLTLQIFIAATAKP